MIPRLNQPLFYGEMKAAKEKPHLYHLIRAYDCIWTLHFEPTDITAREMASNAEANLASLGSLIEQELSEEVFHVDDSQLRFPDEIINPKPAKAE